MSEKIVLEKITRWLNECKGDGCTFSYSPVYINGVLKRYEVIARLPVGR